MAPILGYWDLRGLGAAIRYLLEYAGAEYEEKHYKFGPPPDFDRSNWLNEKFNLGMDFPNLPYYLDGDIKLSQSDVILRYLARKHNLAGKNEIDQLRAEVLLSQVRDLHMEFARLVYDPKFKELRGNYKDHVLPEKLGLLEKSLGENKFACADYITFADFYLFEWLEMELYFAADCLKSFPKLDAYHKRIMSLEAIDKYFKSGKAIKYPFFGAPAFFGGQYSEQLGQL